MAQGSAKVPSSSGGSSAWGDITGKPTTFPPSDHNQAWSTITTTPTTVSGYGITDAQGLDADLTALAGLSTTGIVARTGAGTASTRTITGTTDQVVVTNGDGMAGNPTLALPQSIATTSAVTFGGVVIDAGTGALPAVAGTGIVLRVAGADSTPNAVEGIAFSGTGFAFRGRYIGGTRAAPSATVANGPMLVFNGLGYSTGYEADSNAQYGMFADGLWSGTNKGAYHKFSGTSNGSTTVTEWMRLGNGSLSIGTASATAANKLFVNSLDASRVLFAGTTRGIRFTHNSTGSVIDGVDNTGSASFQPLYLGGSYVAMSISGKEAMRATASGLGIGTATPGAALDVVGEVWSSVALRYKTGTINNCVGTDGTGALLGSISNHTLALWTNNAGRVTISTAGAIRFNNYGAGTLVTDSSGNITASSDRRLKNVSGKFTRGLDAIMEIQPKVFTWKPESGMNTDDVNVGFIAQDVQDAIPEAVGTMKTSDTEEDDAKNPGKKIKHTKREAAEFLTLSDRPIIAALVNAVKELKAKNDALLARVSALENGKVTP